MMKRIQYITVVMALLACGCTDEVVDNAGQGKEMVTVRISAANLPGVQDAATRTVLNGDKSVTWHKGDEVFFVTSTNTSGNKMINIEEDGPTAVFEATFSMAELENSSREAVIYPYKIKEWSGDKLREWFNSSGFDAVVLPAVQVMTPGTFARDYNLSAAVFEISRDEPVYFHNLCGLLRVNVKGNATIKSIKIAAPAKINGKFRVEGLDKKVGKSAEFRLEMTSEDGSSDTVELVSEEGFSLTESLQSFYASVLPKTLQVGSTENAGPGAGEYVVTITTVEGKELVRTVTLDKDIQASKISDLGDFEVNYTFADADGSSFEIAPDGSETLDFNYVPSKGVPVITKPDWVEYTLDEAVGRIVFSAGIYVSGTPRSGEITISQDGVSAVITVTQQGVHALAFNSIHSDAAAHSAYEIAKTEYLADGYTFEIADSDSWITAGKSSEGNLQVSVEANATGNLRIGEVKIKVSGALVETVTVTQTAFSYSDFVGKYELNYWNTADGKNENARGDIEISSLEDKLAYRIFFNISHTKCSMIFDYVGIGPGLMALALPQVSDEMNTDRGIEYYSKIWAAKKPSYSGYNLKNGNYKEIEATGDGIGYDLVPVVGADGKLSIDFVPNAKAQELYPEGLDGIWFPVDFPAEKVGGLDTPVDKVWLWFRPLEDQEYLKIIKK